MSAATSAADSARLYTRTSSSLPLKYSPQTALPPHLTLALTFSATESPLSMLCAVANPSIVGAPPAVRVQPVLPG